MKQEYVPLAHKYKVQYIGGWYASEKIDGIRCIWDGGISRGMDSYDVPYANNVKGGFIATGLWSRYGKVIAAPDWWLDLLPKGFMLDGELDTGNRQVTMSIVKTKDGSKDWSPVEYKTFDMPTEAFFADRTIKTPQYSFKVEDAWSWRDKLSLCLKLGTGFEMRLQHLKDFSPLVQTQLPMANARARAKVMSMLDAIVARGGEGVVLKDRDNLWMTERCKTMLKCKPYSDTEGVVVGFTSGKGRLVGKVGALIVESDGVSFELAGLTDEERGVGYFSIGEVVTFKYRDRTNAGSFNEASYMRKR